MSYFWTDVEIKILKEKYPISTKEEMEKLLPKRTYKAINVKATKLGLTKTTETKQKIREVFGEKQRGELNHRFGKRYRRKSFACVMCGKYAEYDNKFVRQIRDGTRAPTCSNECSVKYARGFISSERTSIEVLMADELSRRGIKYEEQYDLGGKFRLDFLLPEYGIVIECDGDYWHNLPEVKRRDRRKNAYIKACGYSLYRFWESEINTDVEACVDIILAEINEKEATA